MGYKQPETASKEPYDIHTAYVQIKATQVEEIRPGVYSLGIRTQAISDTDRETLRRLYPTLADQAYSLLVKEAVLGAIES